MADRAETAAGEGQPRFPGCSHFRRRRDLHQKCQGCRTKEGGKICSRTDTCAVCHSWSPREWEALDAAIALNVRRRTNRSRSKEGTVTHQEDVLTLEPEEDTDFDDNKKTKSGKGEMSESLPSRFPEDGASHPYRGRTTGLHVRGEAFCCGWWFHILRWGHGWKSGGDGLFFYGETSPVRHGRCGCREPNQGVRCQAPGDGVWCQAPGDGVWCQAGTRVRGLMPGTLIRGPMPGTQGALSPRGPMPSIRLERGRIQRRLIPFGWTERDRRAIQFLQMDPRWHTQRLDDRTGHQVPSWSGPVG